jgi:hypothetical protein
MMIIGQSEGQNESRRWPIVDTIANLQRKSQRAIQREEKQSKESEMPRDLGDQYCHATSQPAGKFQWNRLCLAELAQYAFGTDQESLPMAVRRRRALNDRKTSNDCGHSDISCEYTPMTPVSE